MTVKFRDTLSLRQSPKPMLKSILRLGLSPRERAKPRPRAKVKLKLKLKDV